jgi:hypothetical protein
MEPAPDPTRMGLMQQQTNSRLSAYCPINTKINGVPQCPITLSGLKSRDKVIKINGQCYDIYAFKKYLDETEFVRINYERDVNFNDMSEAITQSFSSISTNPNHVKIFDPLRNPIVGEELTSLFFLYNPTGVFTRSEAKQIREASGGGVKNRKNTFHEKLSRKAFTKKKKRRKTRRKTRRNNKNKYK